MWPATCLCGVGAWVMAKELINIQRVLLLIGLWWWLLYGLRELWRDPVECSEDSEQHNEEDDSGNTSADERADADGDRPAQLRLLP